VTTDYCLQRMNISHGPKAYSWSAGIEWNSGRILFFIYIYKSNVSAIRLCIQTAKKLSCSIYLKVYSWAV
jgi:hypothetical protein